MNSCRLKLTVAACLATSVIALALVGDGMADDRVIPIQGVTASGKIVKVEPHQVTIEVRTKPQTYAVNEIRKVTFDDDPPGLDRARDLVLQDQFEQALDEMKKVNGGSIKNPLTKQDVEFYRYYCEGRLGLAGGGDKAAAVRGLLALVKANSETYHLYVISDLLGELAMALGKPDNAVQYYQALTKAPFEETKAKGYYRLGEVDLARGKIPEARKTLQQLVAAQATTPEMARLKSLAEVGLAVCTARDGKAQEALAQLQQMVQKYDSTDSELFARIYNAQGACNESLGRVHQAVIAYLHTDLLFFADPQSHAEALYNLSVLWPKVNEPQQAQTARQRLGSMYASSAWANKK